MRCTQTACVVSLGLAGSALIVKTVLVSMSGKHKRSPKSGDSPTAKEPKVDRSADVSECKDVQPTAKEIAAAEAARARLNGDTAAVAPVSLGRHCTPHLRLCQVVLITDPANRLWKANCLTDRSQQR